MKVVIFVAAIAALGASESAWAQTPDVHSATGDGPAFGSSWSGFYLGGT